MKFSNSDVDELEAACGRDAERRRRGATKQQNEELLATIRALFIGTDQWIAYPACLSQPAVSLAEMACSAFASTASNLFQLRGFCFRRMDLALDQACSIGFKSGEYGGKKTSSAPRRSMATRRRASV